MTVYGLGQMAANLPAGFLVARWGPRAVQMGTAVGFACAGVLCALAQGPMAMYSLGLACLFQGLCVSANVLARQTFIGASVRLDVRGRTASGMGSVARVAGVLGPSLGGLVAELMGAPAAFLLQLGFAGMGLVTTWAWMPPIRSDQGAKEQ